MAKGSPPTPPKASLFDEVTANIIEIWNETPPLKAEEGLVLLAVIVFIFLVLVLSWRLSRRAGKSIIMLGASGSGKTQMWSILLGRDSTLTVMSQSTNSGSMKGKNGVKKEWELVDVPGFPRIRLRDFERVRESARGLLFVIDSSTVQKEIRDVAEFLFHVLTDEQVQQMKPKIGIVCNKQDLPLSKSQTLVRSILEKELNTLRMTKGSQLDSIDPKKSKEAYTLGRPGQDFSFSELSNVQFLSSSIKDLDEVMGWIACL